MFIKQKINKPVTVIFTNKEKLQELCGDKPIAEIIELIRNDPEHSMDMFSEDFYMSPYCREMPKDKELILLSDYDIFNKYDEKVVRFILEYMQLYPKYVMESNKPDIDFKFRTLKALLIEQDYKLFDKYMIRNDMKKNIAYMASVMRLALELDLTLLSEKCGAVIAMTIKDKPLYIIKNLF